MEAGLEGELQVAEEVERELEVTGEVLFAKICNDSLHFSAFGRAGGKKPGFLAGDLRDQQIAEVAGEFAGEMLGAASVAFQFVHEAEHRRAIPSRERGGHLRHGVNAEGPEEGSNGRGIETVATAGDGLIEGRK